MKKTLSFMVMAFALLFAQCRKPEVKFPSPVAPEGVTVSMTVTAGPGSKTDITADGVITWNSSDELYVGCNGKFVGCLTIDSGFGTQTGKFSGDVTLTDIPEGSEQMFHFFYLGSTKRTLDVGATTVDVSFASQEIYAEDGKLRNASMQHVVYGSAECTVTDGVVPGINVKLESKVALARFSFKKDGADYTDALTLSGDKIYNNMTVGFDGTFKGKTEGNISLTGGHAERYVMLVPAGTDSKTLNFVGGDMTGSTKLENGIEANKFYGRESAIEVTVTPKPKFSVSATTTVEFAPGNLWYGIADGESTPAFHFEANQWDYSIGEWSGEDGRFKWNDKHVSHFFWSNTTDWQESGKEPYAASYSYSTRTTDDVFFTEASGFQVSGETAGTWRTLSKAEWYYLLKSRDNASSLRAWKDFGNNVKGLVILPDGTDASVMSSITSTDALATSGAVFLPAAGYRSGTDVYYVGSNGYYWSCTPYEYNEDYAYSMVFGSGGVLTGSGNRYYGYAFRLVR